jgi:hypothetical protein
MPNTLTLRDVCEVEDGLVKSIDLSKLFFPEPGDGGQEICLVRSAPTPANPDAPRLMSRETAPIQALALRREGTSQLALSFPARVLPPSSFPKRKAAGNLKVRPLPKATYSISRSPDSSLLGGLLAGTGDQAHSIDLELPFGMPQFVSVGTLKAMLGAERDETLFQKRRTRWEPCSDSLEVDLKDRTRLFRLGKVQIYS